MAFEVKFQNGKTATFQNRPTDQDIDEVATQMGISSTQPKPKKDLLGKAAGALDTVFGGGKVGELFGGLAAKSGLTGLSKEERQFVDLPSAKEVGGSAARAGLLFTPMGRGAQAISTGAKTLGAGAKLATGAGRIGVGAGTGFGFDVASGLEQGQDVSEAIKPGIGTAVGGGLPVVGGALRLGGRGIGAFGKNLAAGLSGKGTKVIDAILENPQAALRGLRGQATLPQSATQIRQSVSNLAKQASDEFGADLAGLPKRLGRAPQVITAGAKTTISVGGKKFVLSLQGIKSKVTQELRKFDVKVNPKKGTLDFSEAALDNAEGRRLQEVFDVVKGWKDTTPEGIHKLAKKISNFRKSGEQSKQLNAIIDSVSRNARDYIGDRIPAAKNMLKKFASAQDTINALNQEFATKGRTLGGLAERIKTERKVSNLFSGEKESTLGLLRERVPGGRDIAAQEAGRELGGITRASASLGDLLRSAIQTVLSPRVIGEIVAATGMSQQQVTRLVSQLKKLDEPTRAAVINTLSEVLR